MKKFVVGMILGGDIGDPEFHTEFLKVIEAETEDQALSTYISECNFNIFDFDTITVMGELNGDYINIPINIITKMTTNNHTRIFFDKLKIK